MDHYGGAASGQGVAMGKESRRYNPEGQRARGPEGQRARGPEGQAGGVMSWVLSLARSGGTAGSQGGHETRRHRVHGPFPMGACLLLAGTLALAGCGSSSNSTVAITQQPTQPPSNQPPPQTGGGSGEGEGDGSGGSGSGDQGAGGQGSGGGGGSSPQSEPEPPITQQPTQQPPQQPPQPEPELQTGGGGGSSPQPQPQSQPDNQQPPQTGGGSGGGTGAPSASSGGQGYPIDIDSFKLYAGIDDRYWGYAPNVKGDGSLRIIWGDGYLLNNKTKTVDDDFGWKGYRWKSVESDGSIIQVQTYEKTVRESTPGNKFWYVYNGARASPYLGEYGNSDELAVFADTLKRMEKIHVSETFLDLRMGVNDFGPVTSLNSQGNFVLPGTYDGVAGLYKCYSDSSSTCAIEVTDDGSLSVGTFDTKSRQYTASKPTGVSSGNYWLFQPQDRNDVVPRTIESTSRISSYGWWLRKPADGESNYFADGGHSLTTIGPVHGDIGGLTGTANYIGGAAGIYAFVHGYERGDATSFTARARLMVDFDSNKVKGKIDDFKFGPGGRTDWPERGDWSVELMEHEFDNNGTIYPNPGKTMWTMAGKGFGAGGKWSVYFSDPNGSVITGSFYAVYGAIGKMVGGFGVEREE